MKNHLKYLAIFFVIIFTQNISYSSLTNLESSKAEEKISSVQRATNDNIPDSIYRDKIRSIISNYGSNHYLNASYVISENGKIIAKGARGVYSIEGSETVNLKTNQQMAVASGTKTITASAILRLQDKGMLDVNDTVAKLLPAESKIWPNDIVPEWANKVTLHHLLSHSSGLAEYIPALQVDFTKGHADVKKQILNFAASQPLLFDPGSNYQYGNTGFIILGLIIENLTKEPLSKFFSKEFFKPLAMNKTFLSSMSQGLKYQRGELSYKYPNRYVMVPNGTKNPQLVLAQIPFVIAPFSDGGIVSTAKDMARFHNALHSGEILSEKSYKQMTTAYGKAKGRGDLESSYGYGLFISTLEDGSLLYHHAGNAIAIRSEFGYAPSTKICYSIISNAMVHIPEEIKDKIDFANPNNQIDIAYFQDAILKGIIHSDVAKSQ